MKVYIAIEVVPQKWVADDTVYKCHGSTMAYREKRRLEEIVKIHSSIKYEIIEVEIKGLKE